MCINPNAEIDLKSPKAKLQLEVQNIGIEMTKPQLLRTSVTIREQHDVPETLNIQMVNLSTKISQRPGAQAVRVEAALEHWYVTGLQQQGTVPSLIASVGDSSSSLLTVVFELNPEESAADQLLKIHSQPVEIIYDAERPGRLPGCRVHQFNTSSSLWISRCTWPSVWWRRMPGCPGMTPTYIPALLTWLLMLKLFPVWDFRFKLSGELPLMHFRISDQKIQNIMELVESIPMPKMDSAPSTPTEKVLLELTRQVDQEKTILSFNILQLGAEGKMRSYDMGITSYLRQVSVDYCDVPGDSRLFPAELLTHLVHRSVGRDRLHLISSLQQQGSDLLKVEFIKVEVSSLDFLLHTKALLATISYLNSTVPAQFSATRDQETKKQVQKTEQGWTETNLNAPYMQRRPHQLSVSQSSCRLTPPFVFQMFFDNFQTAKEALSSATSQAAEKAASSVRDFAQKSFRLSMDIRLKAPLIIIPQSSTSQNALVVDLGLITVENSFALRSGEGFPVPVVVLLSLKKLIKQEEAPFLVFQLDQLGINTKVRMYDMSATTRRVSFTNLLSMFHQADRSGPDFCTTHKNTEQMIHVTFTSLDVMLHTEALLSAVNFLSSSLSSSSMPSAEKEVCLKTEEKMASAKSRPQTHISARLRDIIVLDVDPKSIHKEVSQMALQVHVSKAISIVGDEVFSFSMSLTPNATEGAGYADTSKTDGKVKLTVGCIQVVYLHKFIMSLLNFSNNFQTTKEALSNATAQAAEKAASSVRDLAQKSFRLSMDLYYISAFKINVGLNLLFLVFFRTWLDSDSKKPNAELLKPVNLQLNIRRNLSATWYKKMAAVEVNGDLKPMKVLVSVLTKSLCKMCPLCSAGAQSGRPESHAADRDREPGRGRWSGSLRPPTGGQPAGSSYQRGPYRSDNHRETLKLEAADLWHHQNLRLGELALRLMKASGKILNNGSMEVNTILTSCTLDDVRSGVDRVTSRMVGLKEENGHQAMIDVTFRQDPAERELVAVLQKLYLCVSVEFLMAVADFFLQALPQSPAAATLAAPSDKLPLRRNQKLCLVSAASAVKTLLRVVIVDPEVVFVANLMNADAPALMASFQGDFNLLVEEDSTQKMRANLRDLKVLACPFIQSKENKAVTTVGLDL
ncbi:hypothetical protein XENOCAPTIV_029627 [Xenoophorus captivus]|uniref:VPS13-like middle region domain-containing protein n=1 Tax=Xenoophorus captivus TaxID=1517983 RepID=A0ABV0SCJ2_9TELE